MALYRLEIRQKDVFEEEFYIRIPESVEVSKGVNCLRRRKALYGPYASGCSDAYYARDIDTRRSTSGFVFMFAGAHYYGKVVHKLLWLYPVLRLFGCYRSVENPLFHKSSNQFGSKFRTKLWRFSTSLLLTILQTCLLILLSFRYLLRFVLHSYYLCEISFVVYRILLLSSTHVLILLQTIHLHVMSIFTNSLLFDYAFLLVLE